MIDSRGVQKLAAAVVIDWFKKQRGRPIAARSRRDALSQGAPKVLRGTRLDEWATLAGVDLDRLC